MSDELLIGLAGGAIGALLAALFAQAGRAWAAWSAVSLHDEEAVERNRQLVAWVDDRTRDLVKEMQAISEEHNRRNTFYSGMHGGDLAEAKGRALHEYRDEEWRSRIDLARLRASEGAWHWLWRKARKRPAPALTSLPDVEPFLERWREPATRHGTEAAAPIDRTRRTLGAARAELADLSLT
jgi:hypothetical protein